jgi:hypothetical protein
MKKISFFASLLLLSSSLSAQNVSDVLKYSSLQIGGTARSLGAGNAIAAALKYQCPPRRHHQCRLARTKQRI